MKNLTARLSPKHEGTPHNAEEVVQEQAERARVEVAVFRKAMLALTRDLRMDELLDTLLGCVLEVVPCDAASVMLTEEDGSLFVARVLPSVATNRHLVTVELNENPFLARVVRAKKNVFVTDTRSETDWHETKPLRNVHCWIGVPLIFGEFVLGVLSIGTVQARTLTTEHFRVSKSLAIPIAVAIHNARLREWAAIYAAERQNLLTRAEAVGTEEHNRSREKSI